MVWSQIWIFNTHPVLHIGKVSVIYMSSTLACGEDVESHMDHDISRQLPHEQRRRTLFQWGLQSTEWPLQTPQLKLLSQQDDYVAWQFNQIRAIMSYHKMEF